MLTKILKPNFKALDLMRQCRRNTEANRLLQTKILFEIAHVACAGFKSALDLKTSSSS
jgi:hypothetical protein